MTNHHPQNVTLDQILPYLVSKKSGVLKGVNTLFRGAADPQVHVAISELTNSRRYLDCFGEVSGTGVGLTKNNALMAAIGEAVEGYCAYDIQSTLEKGSYRQIIQTDPLAVSPQELPLYSQTQYALSDFRYRPFTEESVIRWAKGTSAISGKTRSLPAALVYVSYIPEENESPLCHTIFGGIASSTSYTSAMLSGVYEAVERDAMMIWWLGQHPTPQVSLSSESWIGEIFKENFADSGLTFELWNITMDIPIPVFFGLVTDTKNNAIAGGFGTNLNPNVAALKALFECVQNRLGQLPMKSDWGRTLYNQKNQKVIFSSEQPDTSSSQFVNMTNLDKNLHTYLEPEGHRLLDTVRSNTSRIELADVLDRSTGSAQTDLQECLSILEQKGFDVITTDLTHDDVADLGFVVLRVSIPGLVPNSVTAWPHLGNQRLYSVPRALGLQEKTEESMALFPMPYA